MDQVVTESCRVDLRGYWKGTSLWVEIVRSSLSSVSPSVPLLLLHGWPDTPLQLFTHQIQTLAQAGYTCILVTLPYYHIPSPSAQQQHHSNPEVPLTPHSTELQSNHTPQFAGVLNTLSDIIVHFEIHTIIAHDWGSIVSFGLLHRFQNTLNIKRFISLDLGTPARIRLLPETSLFVRIIANSYFVTNALCYAIGGAVGSFVSRTLARAGKCPNDVIVRAGNNAYKLCWPYYRAVLGVLKMKFMVSLDHTDDSDVFLNDVNRFKPQFPVLFLYGSASPLRYFDEEWSSRVKQSHESSEIHHFNSDHWFMCRSKTREAVTECILRWLTQTEPHTIQ